MTRRDDLIDQYRQIHAASPRYGRSSEKQKDVIVPLLREIAPFGSILDYGCGRSRLVDWLAKEFGAEARRYDPAIAAFSAQPAERADVVVNTDVLEHIPEGDIAAILKDIAGISDRVFFNISLVEAISILPNGENAHCTVRPADWWENELRTLFPDVRPVPSYRTTTCSFVTWPPPTAGGASRP